MSADIIVEVGNSTSPVVSSDQFLEEVPYVTSVSPNSGSVTGATNVDIGGSGFTNADTVSFVDTCGDSPVAAASFKVVSDTEITAVTPNDSAQYQSCAIAGGEDTLTADVIVTVPDAALGSNIASVAQSQDQFTFDNLPVVSQVYDLTTNEPSGPIIGNDQMGIKGTAFTNATEVVFSLPSDPNAPVDTVGVAAFDDNDIFLPEPDVAAFAGDIPAGQSGLLLDVSVGIPDADGDGGFTFSPITAKSVFTFTLPQVASVIDTTTNTNSGPLIGQDQLNITGTGFNLQNGGSLAVQFEVNGTTVWQSTSADSVQVNSTGTVLTLTEPDLIALENQISQGQPGLVTDVVVEVYDGQGAKVSSPTNPTDQFTFTVPEVASVINTDGGTNSGSVAGGETVKIKGSNLTPPGPTTDVIVTFTDPDGKSVFADQSSGVNLVSSSEIDVTVPPAFAQLGGDIPPGAAGEIVDVQVEFQTPDGNETSTTGGVADQFELTVPVVTSIVDSNTNSSAGPISGGGFVQLNGSNFNPPSSATNVVVTFTDSKGHSVSIDQSSSVFVQSNQQINLTLPNASAQLGADVPAGASGVVTDVQVTFVTPTGNIVSTVNPPGDQFTFTVLSITSAAAATFTVGQSGSFDVTTSDANVGTPVTLSESGALPDGVTFTDNGNGTATLAGTPAAGTGNDYDITITASDGVEADVTQSFDLTVLEPPAITSAGSTTFTAGKAGTFAVTATGYDGQAAAGSDNSTGVTFTETGALPNGVTLTDNGDGTATLGGTPTTDAGGNYTFTITATNGVAPDATQAFDLEVLAAPTITSPNTTTFTQGQAGTFTITATGYAGQGGEDDDDVSNPTGVTFSESGQLPAGITFTDNGDGTATLAGTTTALSDEYDVTITATNGVSPDATQILIVEVLAPPTFSSSAATTFTVGQQGTFVVSTGFEKGTSGITLSELGSLPDGVTFTDNGDGTAILAGTPASGSGAQYDLALMASNGVAPDAVQEFELTVLEAPSITSADTTDFTVGQAGSFDVTATGYAGPDAGSATGVTFAENGPLPDGVDFTDNGEGTAVLEGTPAGGTGGTYPFTIKASNGVSPAATQSFSLVVLAPPTITSAAATNFTVGQAGTFKITTTGNDSGTSGVALSESGDLPDGVTFTDNGDGTATLAGTPADGSDATYDFTVKQEK